MTVNWNQETNSLTFTAECEEDTLDMGRLSCITNVKVGKHPSQGYYLELSVADILNAILRK